MNLDTFSIENLHLISNLLHCVTCLIKGHKSHFILKLSLHKKPQPSCVCLSLFSHLSIYVERTGIPQLQNNALLSFFFNSIFFFLFAYLFFSLFSHPLPIYLLEKFIRAYQCQQILSE